MDPEERGVDTDRLRRDIEATRASLSGTVGELRQKAGEAMHWQTYVERYPVPILAASALLGLTVGRRMARAFNSSHRGAGHQWAPGDAVTRIPARVDAGGVERFAAVNASWRRLGSRVEALVNRVIDDVADATERALVPAVVGGLQALFEGRARPGHRASAWDPGPTETSEEGRRT
jgi:Protein of unknown function (DUF3618)